MRASASAWARRAFGLGVLLALAAPRPVAAQYEVGLGFQVAETRTNALGLGASVSWSPTSWFALRGFLDAEHGVPDFKEGLEYDENSNRVYIVDQQGVAQNPKGDDLWQGQGWDLHAATYATVGFWRISVGPGLAYNGHDGPATSGLALVVVGDVSSRTEIDIELLQGGSWRMRISVGFWQFP